MWFALVAAGLAVIIAAGIYVRRCMSGTLAEVGVGARRVRAVRSLIVWLLFGFPLIATVSISASLALGFPIRYASPGSLELIDLRP